MEMLILILVVGIVLANMRSARYRARDTAANLIHNDSLGNAETTTFTSTESDDIFTSPVFSHIPGNIYHHLCDETIGNMFDDDLCTDPAYSFLACNIYHTDDDCGMNNSSSPFQMDD